MPSSSPFLDQLKRALAISEEIARLEFQLDQLLGREFREGWGTGNGRKRGNESSTAPKARPKKGTMSLEARARIAAAQRARWAKSKGVRVGLGTDVTAKPTKKGKRKHSPEVRARLAAAMKARWAAARKSGKLVNARR